MNDKKYLIFFIIFSFLLFLIINIPTPIKIQGDGVFYYGWATSIIFDHDIDLTNQLMQTYSYDFYSKYFIDNNITTQTNITPNPYAFGTAILWAPFIFIVNIIYSIAKIFGIELCAQNGYSDIYVLALNFATWIWGSIAVVMIYKTVRYYFNPYISALTVIGLWLATPFVYYQFFEPSMAHTASIMSSSIFLWYTIKSIHKQKMSYIIVGITLFLMIAVRWQNIVFVVAMLPVYLHFLSKQMNIKLFVTIFLSVISFILLQIFAWKSIYDTYLIIPQGNDFIGVSFYFVETLFSTNRGLLTWSPIIIFAFFGIYFLYKKHKYIAITCVLAFLLQWMVNSILSDPGGGDAFGGRRFISTLPFIALMLGAFIERLHKRYIVIALVSLIIVWNLVLIQAYRLNIVPHNGKIEIFHII